MTQVVWQGIPMEDLRLWCLQCGQSFTFPVKEQKKYSAQGFNHPKRCPECRRHKIKLDSNAPADQSRSSRLPWDDEAEAFSVRRSKRRQKERLQRQSHMERNQ
jgi:hypothetical protein